MDDQLHYSLPFNNPRDVVYAPSGTRLAVIRADGVTVVDADDGGTPANYVGPFSDVAFRPTDAFDLAMVQPSAGIDGYLVIVIGDGGLYAGSLIPAIENGQISLPKVTWSPDGTRVTAAYDVRQPDDSHWLYLREWTISGGQMSEPPVIRGWEVAPHEELIDVAYVASNLRILSTTKGLWRLDPDDSQHFVSDRQTTDVDLSQSVYVNFALIAVGHEGGHRVVLFGDGPIAGLEPDEDLEPWIDAKSDIALSAPLGRIAVTAPEGSPGNVVVYRLDTQAAPPVLIPMHTFPATSPHRPAFRPFHP